MTCPPQLCKLSDMNAAMCRPLLCALLISFLTSVAYFVPNVSGEKFVSL